MPQLLRAIRKRRWSTEEEISGLSQGEIQADALGDLVTKNNTLSFWYIKDDRSNLETVIIALAANRDTISNLDYVLFNIDLVSEIGIKIEANEGGTPYDKANHWHRDLVGLSATQIVKLAEIISLHSDKKRISEKQILNLIKDAVKNGDIDMARLKPDIARKLN